MSIQGVELEALKLLPHQFQTHPQSDRSPARFSVLRADGVEFEINASFAPFMQLLQSAQASGKSISLAQLADLLRNEPIGSRFLRLAKFLIFLYDADLLADSRHVRLAESLKPQYEWSPSVVLSPIFESELVASKPNQNGPATEHLNIVLAAVTAFAATWLVVLGVSRALAGDGVFRSPSELLVSILVAFTIGRSVRALTEFIFGLFRTRRPGLILKLDLFSISLTTTTTAHGASISGFIASAFAIGFCAFTALFDRSSGVYASAAMLVVFAEASPFAKSALTDALSSFYSSLSDKKAMKSEALLRRSHIVWSFVWSMAVGSFVSLVSPTLSRGVFLALLSNSGTMKAFIVLGGALWVAIVLSWVMDILGSVSYDQASARDVRRIWRKKVTQASTFSEADRTTPWLESLPLLRQLDAETRRRLLARSSVRRLNAGEAACRQGEKDRFLFVVLEGRLAVTKRFSVSRRHVVAFLEAGSVFGEAAFFFGHPRSADVIATEPSRVIAIPHDETMKTLSTERGAELQTRVWFLQALVSGSFLKEIPSEALDAVIHAGRPLRVNAGSRVIQEGEAADSCYFIVQGQASVTQNFKLINKMGAGDAFGEIAVLSQGAFRTATVHADSDLLLIMIDAVSFWNLLRAHLPLAVEIERVARARLAKDRARAQSKSN